MLKTKTYFSSSVTSMRKQALDASYTLIILPNMAKVTSTQMVKISWNTLKKTILYLPTQFSITKSTHRNLFLDSRSHGNLSTTTDHKLVKARINLEWWRLKRQFKKSERLDVNRLRDLEMSQRYRKDLKTRLEVERQENERRDTNWKRIAKTCKETVRNTVGIKQFSKTQSSSLIVQELSLKQRKLKTDKESNQNKEQRRELNIERNKFL